MVAYFHLPAIAEQKMTPSTHIAKKAFGLSGPELVVLGISSASSVVK